MDRESNLFARMSSAGKSLIPVNYRFVEPIDQESIAIRRLAKSRFYHADGYDCWAFRKPISKYRTRDLRVKCTSEHISANRDSKADLPSIQAPCCGKDDVFVLFACCVPVRGARRSLICDLQRSELYLIPNGLFDILTNYRGKTMEEIKIAYDYKNDQEIDEYFDFLISRDLGFWCADPDCFPDIDLSWEAPERITNAIIDADDASLHDYGKIFGELDDLGCKALELRFFTSPGLDHLEAVLEAAAYGRLRSIDILMAYDEAVQPEALEQLISRYQRVNSLVIHSAPEARDCIIGRKVKFRHITQVVRSSACCGQIHPRDFAINLESFAEAHRFNSCLNRKVSIDPRGEIRNCPSLPLSFGNARDVSLHNAVAHRDFSALWEINKDQIEVCKDCEFRYICTDCRAYIASPGDVYSKPSKCTYNPYTAEW